ncbi:MAG: hypothetical protein QHH80_14650 [Anaerolineae bacterium]|jgi:hypothetical protein|nr:hypothetical protein [Anaerolineae bacterium]
MNTETTYRSPDTYRVLVVLVNSRRDWEIVQTQGWYRIPVNRAPRQVGADLLAFYFSKVFADMAWSVRFVAPVLRFELARRRELLPDEADHPRADDWYYRVVLGPLEPLPRPIPSRRLRRLVFLPTTLGRLLSAEEINDLWIREPLEERVWRALKGAGLRPEASFEVRDAGMRYEIAIAIPCAQGGVGVGLAERAPVPPGWTYVSAASAGGDMAGVVARVLAEVQRRGGAWV